MVCLSLFCLALLFYLPRGPYKHTPPHTHTHSSHDLAVTSNQSLGLPSLFSLGPRLPLDHSCQLPLASPSLEFFPRPSQSAVRVHDLAIPAPFLTSHQETSPNSPERVFSSASPPAPPWLLPAPGAPPASSPPARPSRLQGWAGSRRTHSCKLGVPAGLDPRTPQSWRKLNPEVPGAGPGVGLLEELGRFPRR